MISCLTIPWIASVWETLVRAALLDADFVATGFAREMEIRQRARQLLFAADATRKLQQATQSAPHRESKFHQGQWVFVYRRVPRKGPKPNGLLRDRWVGPGLVALQMGTTVCVGMRSRLWKCSTEQVRLATSPEALGAELLSQPALGGLLG